jgi:hypothetical protein
MTETLYIDLRNLSATEFAEIDMPTPADIWQNSTFRFIVPGDGSVTGATAERVDINFATVDDGGLAASETVSIQPKLGAQPNAAELRCVQRGALWGWVYNYVGPSESGSITIGDVSGLLASEAQAIAGTANDVLMTPLRTADNVTARIANLATAQTGTDTVKLMTPQRTTDNVTARIATNGEATTGSNNTKLMTPLRVAEAIAAAASVTAGGKVAVRVYTIPDTWTAPPDLARLDVIAVGGGGGGGAGRRGALGVSRIGGGGGGAGAVHAATFYAFSPEMLSLTITVGAGGTGGVAGTSSGTTSVSGGAGGAGDDSTVVPTGYAQGIMAKGGAGGAGGGTGANANGGGDDTILSTIWQGVVQGTHEGATSNGSGAAVDAITSVLGLPTGGGAGGSISAANILYGPSRGGQHGSTLTTGGTLPNYYYADGEPTTTPDTTRKGWGADSGVFAELVFRPSTFGIGGAGGAASDGSSVNSSAVGGKGGDGLEYGAGGGGGGCGLAVAGSTGGQGGRGANGIVILIEYYAD